MSHRRNEDRNPRRTKTIENFGMTEKPATRRNERKSAATNQSRPDIRSALAAPVNPSMATLASALTPLRPNGQHGETMSSEPRRQVLLSNPTTPAVDVAHKAACHLFLSYCRTDVGYARRLVRHLAESGLDVWYDHDLGPGETFSRVIQEHIQQCSALIVLLTPSALESTWVMRELSFADSLGRRIVPLLRVPCTVPLVIQGIQVLDVTHGKMPGRRFIEQLRQLTGGHVT